MKKTIIKRLSIIILFGLSSFLYSQSSPEREIITTVKKFFTYLRENNEKELKKILCNEIKLKNISKEELIRLAEKMLDEKISISEYIITVTGNNICKFLDSSFILLHYKIEKQIGTEVILVKNEIIKEKLYYIKVLITYKEGERVIKNKRCEVDVIRDNTGEYKILGFII